MSSKTKSKQMVSKLPQKIENSLREISGFFRQKEKKSNVSDRTKSPNGNQQKYETVSNDQVSFSKDRSSSGDEDNGIEKKTYLLQKVKKVVNGVVDFAYKYRWHIIALILIVSVTLVFHGYNMFNYPYYENDEGTYLSRAWSLLQFGKLDPYTYWYDHVPFASFILAGWLLISGGLDTFGMVVNSGRVFMLIIHVLNMILIYYIGWRMTGRRLMGVLAAILYTVSPLAIYFYRRVLLDNIIVFFMLATLAILIKEKLTLRWIFLSAVTFALGVLTKENVAIFLPIYLAIIFFRTEGTRRLLGSLNWLMIAGGLISLYFFYALFKQEFFPPGMLGTPEESVSLIHTLTFHLGRGSELPFWAEGSDFMGNLRDWLDRDRMILSIGAISTLILIPLSLKDKWARLLLAFSLVHIWFLIRGGLILNFYIIPVLPFLVLNVGYIADKLIQFSYKKYDVPKYYFYTIFSILLGIFIFNMPKNAFTVDENEAYREIVAWARENLEGDEMIVTDNAIYVDLKAVEKEFPNAEWFYKVDTDPEVYEDKLGKDWKNIDYIFLSHETVKQLAGQQFVYIQSALENSPEVARWEENSTAFVNVQQYLSTNGDWGRIYKVPSSSELRKKKTWEHVANNYLISYGQIYDPVGKKTTSYMQTNAMYHALLSDDRNTFNSLRGWTLDHFGYRQEDELLSRLWIQKDEGSDGKVTDTSSHARADIQYTAALLMAYEKWGSEEYLNEALQILPDIWEKEIIEIRGRYYVGEGSNSAIFNPGSAIVDKFYIDMYAGLPEYIKLFEKYDPERDWSFVREDWYFIAENVLASRAKGKEIEIFPEVLLLSIDGSITPFKSYDPYSSANTMMLLSLYENKDDELVDRFLKNLNPTQFNSVEFKDVYGSKPAPSNVSAQYLVSDLISYNKGDFDQGSSFFGYLDRSGFSYETGRWENVVGLNNYYNVWAISYLLDLENEEDN